MIDSSIIIKILVKKDHFHFKIDHVYPLRMFVS